MLLIRSRIKLVLKVSSYCGCKLIGALLLILFLLTDEVATLKEMFPTHSEAALSDMLRLNGFNLQATIAEVINAS